MVQNNQGRGQNRALTDHEQKKDRSEEGDTRHLLNRLIRIATQSGMIGVILFAGLLGAFFINSLEAAKPAAGGHEHGHGHGDKHGEEKIVSFGEKNFKNANLGLATAGPVTLYPALSLNGIIVPNEERLVQVTPRFPGVVRRIHKRLGSRVERGDVLLSIEGDDDLKRYDVSSAISGTVISRRVGLGEHVERNDKLMVIADLATVWVDFRVFARDFKKLRLHQPIEIALASGGPPVQAQIAYISPIGQADTQTMLARAIVENKDGRLRPGLFVSGRLRIGQQKALIAVRNSAIQFLDGKPVVFVEQKENENEHEHEHAGENGHQHEQEAGGHEEAGDHHHDEKEKKRRFKAVFVETGPSDGRFTEIYFGLLPGQTYVADNSFMLKAELSKGMAAHSH